MHHTHHNHHRSPFSFLFQILESEILLNLNCLSQIQSSQFRNNYGSHLIRRRLRCIQCLLHSRQTAAHRRPQLDHLPEFSIYLIQVSRLSLAKLRMQSNHLRYINIRNVLHRLRPTKAVLLFRSMTSSVHKKTKSWNMFPVSKGNIL